MDVDTIVKILDLIPDAEVIWEPNGGLRVHRGPKRTPSGQFAVNKDGTLRPATQPPPLPESWDKEKTPTVTTGHVRG